MALEPERNKKKSVLGLRLSYMSKISEVRRTIQEEMQLGRDLLDLMRPLTIKRDPEDPNDDVVIDFVTDEKADFAGKLNTLQPNIGADYLREPEVRWDKAKKRNHDWTWWEDRLTPNSSLSLQLHKAVEAALGHEKEVDAFGNYESPEPAVYDYDSDLPLPQLDFQTTERYVRDPMTDK